MTTCRNLCASCSVRSSAPIDHQLTKSDTPALELKNSPLAPGLYVHVPSKKSNAGLVEQDERFIPVRSGKTAKTYLFNVSTSL